MGIFRCRDISVMTKLGQICDCVIVLFFVNGCYAFLSLLLVPLVAALVALLLLLLSLCAASQSW